MRDVKRRKQSMSWSRTVLVPFSCSVSHISFSLFTMVALLRVAAALIGATGAASAAIREFDTCGVLSSDFMNDSFEGQYRVAGPSGCALGGLASSAKEDCFCGPEIDGEERLGEWLWQCEDNIAFGPVGAKTCPAEVPVPVINDKDITAEVVRELREAGEMDCDVEIHPGGHPGDEVCGYSDCDQGGDFTAVCACVDMSRYGVEGGPQWHCLHSTCSCGEGNVGKGGTSGASSVGVLGVGGAIAAMSFAAFLFN